MRSRSRNRPGFHFAPARFRSTVDSNGRTIWIADAHRDDGKRFVVRANEFWTAFFELESQCLQENWQTRSFPRAVRSVRNVLMSATADCRAVSQSNSPGNRFRQSVCSLRYWSISRALCQMFSRETPSDSRKCSHKISFLTKWRASVRSTSINCASFMAYGNT